MANSDPLTLPSQDPRRDGVAGLTQIPAGKVELEAELTLPPGSRGLVLFVGTGSSRRSPRCQRVAQALRQHGLGTLLFDAWTRAERRQDAIDERLRFDIGLLARRLVRITDWVRRQAFGALPLGYFGAGAGAAAALVAAADRPNAVQAVVCSQGKPDLAASALRRLRAPTLLIVGGAEPSGVESNELALSELPRSARLELLSGDPWRLDEPAALEVVSDLAGSWYVQHLTPAARLSAP